MRTDEEQTAVAMAMLDGMADLWFAESGFARVNLPEPIVRMIKQAHVEGVYTGRCSNVDDAKAKERERIAAALEYEGDNSPCAEDGSVYRSAAWLVRGDFSYEEAERLQIAAERAES